MTHNIVYKYTNLKSKREILFYILKLYLYERLARRLIHTMDELTQALHYQLDTVPRRNWPMLEDHYPMAVYVHPPLKMGCRQFCDRMFCLSQLCLSRQLKNSFFPAGRVISVPCTQSDRHLPLNLR